MRSLFIAGITGSIGSQAIEVLEETSNLDIKLISGSVNSNWNKLKDIIKNHKLKYAAISNPTEDIPNEFLGCKIYKGEKSTEKIIELSKPDISLIATSGAKGLSHTITASYNSKRIALANKESLVLGGDLILNLFRTNNNELIPVDSEHSAIFQLMLGEENIEEILLTASGGSLRDIPVENFNKLSKKDVLNHPNWSMGKRITIDSASMVNKVLEVIEAYYLFNTKNINIYINRNSHVHSMIKFKDGVIKIHYGKPSMKVPIAYALTYPKREYKFDSPNLFDTEIKFEKPQNEKYPILNYLDKILGNQKLHIALNAADEVAVKYFLTEKIKFIDIFKIIKNVIDIVSAQKININTFKDIFNLDNECRIIAENFIKEEL